MALKQETHGPPAPGKYRGTMSTCTNWCGSLGAGEDTSPDLALQASEAGSSLLHATHARCSKCWAAEQFASAVDDREWREHRCQTASLVQPLRLPVRCVQPGSLDVCAQAASLAHAWALGEILKRLPVTGIEIALSPFIHPCQGSLHFLGHFRRCLSAT